MKYLNSKQIEEYHENGFLHVKKLFTKKECANLKIILKQEINKGKEIYKKFKRKNNKDITYNKNKLADVPRNIDSGFLQDIAHRNPEIMQLARNLKMIKLVSQIFGKDVIAYRLYRSLSIFKTKNISSRTPWHQDMLYWKGNSNKLSIWISLDQVSKKSGSVCYIPGSHKHIYQHVESDSYLIAKNVDESKRIAVETEIGDVLIHHSMVVHGSEENIMKKNRYALIFTYQPATDDSHHRSGFSELIQQRIGN
jgi:ectoine hydroxylase-related dioxygenase (phytanoyl-CoA dioxygenase family)